MIRWCPRNHDKTVVGVTSQGYCHACRRLADYDRRVRTSVAVAEAAPLVASLIRREGGYAPASRAWSMRFGCTPAVGERLFHRIAKGEVSRVRGETYDRLWTVSA